MPHACPRSVPSVTRASPPLTLSVLLIQRKLRGSGSRDLSSPGATGGGGPDCLARSSTGRAECRYHATCTMEEEAGVALCRHTRRLAGRGVLGWRVGSFSMFERRRQVSGCHQGVYNAFRRRFNPTRFLGPVANPAVARHALKNTVQTRTRINRTREAE